MTKKIQHKQFYTVERFQSFAIIPPAFFTYFNITIYLQNDDSSFAIYKKIMINLGGKKWLKKLKGLYWLIREDWTRRLLSAG